MTHHPFAHKPPRAKRPEPRRTKEVRLHGEEMSALRFAVRFRAGSICETCGIYALNGELSHLQHGPNKADTLEGCIWECKPCHRKRHNAGGKPCPRKPGRVMAIKHARSYWYGIVCFCTGPKKSQESFCADCRLGIKPQTALDLENAEGEEWRRAVATAELEILAAQRVESAG